MEVSYTDHSHIIGRGGNTISRVMEETRCHVHFPDSNRTTQTEKSNLVTVAGELVGVEKARARVRVNIHPQSTSSIAMSGVNTKLSLYTNLPLILLII